MNAPPCSASAVARLLEERVRIAHRGGDQHAELIAAQPVDGPMGLDRFPQTAPEPREQRIPGDMPERVVVALESVEVEEPQECGLVVARTLADARQVLHQRSTIVHAG